MIGAAGRPLSSMARGGAGRVERPGGESAHSGAMAHLSATIGQPPFQRLASNVSIKAVGTETAANGVR